MVLLGVVHCSVKTDKQRTILVLDAFVIFVAREVLIYEVGAVPVPSMAWAVGTQSAEVLRAVYDGQKLSTQLYTCPCIRIHVRLGAGRGAVWRYLQ